MEGRLYQIYKFDEGGCARMSWRAEKRVVAREGKERCFVDNVEIGEYVSEPDVVVTSIEITKQFSSKEAKSYKMSTRWRGQKKFHFFPVEKIPEIKLNSFYNKLN